MASLLTCLGIVAHLYALPPRVLPSIMAVEGGLTDSVHANTNGSFDMGVMQINSRWLPSLSRYTGLPKDEVQRRLLSQPCFNIAIAGAILRNELDADKNDLMLAIGDYHSHTLTLNQSYQKLVAQAAVRLFAEGRAGTRFISQPAKP